MRDHKKLAMLYNNEMEFIRPFERLGKGDTAIAGGKGASLGGLTRAGIPVPPGFVLLAVAFDRFLDEADLRQELDTILHSVNHGQMHTVEHASEKIQQLILTAEIPKDIAEEIRNAFHSLNTDYVAVRSSATAEDGARAAWAGQLETYLNTREGELVQNVRRCWASLFTPRAIFYRFEKGMHESKISVAVVIQKMIQSEASGIAFSVHPVTEDRNQLIIEAGFGLGEAIVSGQVTPDSYVVEKELRRILDKNISTQTRALARVHSRDGNEWVSIPEPKASSQVLPDARILELSALIMKIEQHYGFPCDIEWAFAGGQFYITQSRPITTLTGGSSLSGSTQFNSVLARQPEFHLHFTVADVGPLLLDIHLAPHAYGALDYWAVIERGVLRGYLTTRGIQEAYELSRHLLDAKFLTTLLTKAESVAQKLGNFRPIKINSNNALSEWDTVVSLWDDMWSVYRYCEEPVQKALEERVLAAYGTEEAVRVLSQSDVPSEASSEVVYAINTLRRLGAVKLDLHLKAEELFKEGLRSFALFLGKVHGVTEQEFSALRKHEVRMLLEGTSVSMGEVRARLSGCIFVRKRGEWECLTGEAFIEYKQRIERALPDVISGTVAYRGRVQGPVVKHLSWTDTTPVPEGSVLVTGMTNPQMVPYLQNAVAIVTDEGGLTCHAAILAREMKIPCIVGTQVATQLLSDGDTVEVDAEKGTVSVLTSEGEKMKSAQKHIYEFVWGSYQALSIVEDVVRAVAQHPENPWNVGKNMIECVRDNSIRTFYSSRDVEARRQLGEQFLNEEFHSSYMRDMATAMTGMRDFYKHLKDKKYPNLSNEELISDFREIHEHWRNVITYFYAIFPESILPLIDAVRPHVSTEELDTLIQSPRLDEANQEAVAWWKLLQQPLSGKRLTEHAYVYPWIVAVHFTYEDAIDSLTQRFEFDALRAKAPEIEKEKRLLIERQSLILKRVPGIRPYVERLQHLSDAKMGIKATWAGLEFYAIPILAEISSRTGVPVLELNLSYRIEEIVKLLCTRETISEATKARRKHCFVARVEDGIDRYYEGEEAERVAEELLGEIDSPSDRTELRGVTAWAGTVRGTVRVLHANDVNKAQMMRDIFKQGDIFVTEMTQPNVMDIAKRAGAIVTDEGGLLSHAAIISREYRIPCVIRTKLATRLLKDGDMVEVDASNAIVTLLKRQ